MKLMSISLTKRAVRNIIGAIFKPAMPDQKSITILHLSDPQFGRNHRFGNLAAGDPDAQFDTLLQRLKDDLDLLIDKQGVKPQIVVVSGDLAEWSLEPE